MVIHLLYARRSVGSQPGNPAAGAMARWPGATRRGHQTHACRAGTATGCQRRDRKYRAQPHQADAACPGLCRGNGLARPPYARRRSHGESGGDGLFRVAAGVCAGGLVQTRAGRCRTEPRPHPICGGRRSAKRRDCVRRVDRRTSAMVVAEGARERSYRHADQPRGCALCQGQQATRGLDRGDHAAADRESTGRTAGVS